MFDPMTQRLNAVQKVAAVDKEKEKQERAAQKEKERVNRLAAAEEKKMKKRDLDSKKK